MSPAQQCRRRGQALLESCLVMAVISLALFGIIQIARLVVSREVMDYAAAAGARAYAVGFNDYMVHKVVRVAAIPNAGRLSNPDVEENAGGDGWANRAPGDLWETALLGAPASQVYQAEQSRIPLYLSSPDMGELPAILDYADWDDLRHNVVAENAALVRGDTRQEIPLRIPMHRAFYDADQVTLEGKVEIENHSSLYLQ